MHYLFVGLGGFAGAIFRYFFIRMLSDHSQVFPIATLMVNLLGSFLLGLFSTWILSKTHLEFELRLAIQIGFLGSFTTFSTFSYDTLNLAMSGFWGRASLNIALNLILCLLAVWLGVVAAKQLG